MTATLTILGCGSSGGVPRLSATGAPDWGDCDPSEPRNARRRCSALVTRTGTDGVTRVLIDSSPDLRVQLLDAGVGVLDAVIYTHSHADHVHGIDDLRLVAHARRARLPVWADAATTADLLARFEYAFSTPPGSSYPPICDLRTLDGPVSIAGAGGTITFEPIPVEHGWVRALGFRIGDAAYLPDVSAIPDAAWPLLDGLNIFVVDALRHAPHPTHAHLARTLDWIARATPTRAVITNMHVDMDYATLRRDLPQGVEPAYDGLHLPFTP